MAELIEERVFVTRALKKLLLRSGPATAPWVVEKGKFKNCWLKYYYF
jgi:hypothetical protein